MASETPSIPILFVSDLHGRQDRYRRLLEVIEDRVPRVVLLGGDLLPSAGLAMSSGDPRHRHFVRAVLRPWFEDLRSRMGTSFPRVLLILGNDDARSNEAAVMEVAETGLWTYLHARRAEIDGITFHGYSFIPPSPFRLKDWERYDVSRFVDPGCVPPENGSRTLPVSRHDATHRTIAEDLDRLSRDASADSSVWLFHCPPYETRLDRADLDGQMVDHAPLDVHVGSIAIRRFIQRHQPRLTLHGHVHESARLTGSWRDTIGETHCLGAAHDGPELALVQVDVADPEAATRELC